MVTAITMTSNLNVEMQVLTRRKDFAPYAHGFFGMHQAPSLPQYAGEWTADGRDRLPDNVRASNAGGVARDIPEVLDCLQIDLGLFLGVTRSTGLRRSRGHNLQRCGPRTLRGRWQRSATQLDQVWPRLRRLLTVPSLAQYTTHNN